jgi:hypothetical protein
MTPRCSAHLSVIVSAKEAAMPRQPLRAVSADEKPPAKRPLSITQAADAGDHLELLRALRARVAKTVEDPNCPARELASLSRRLQELVREIEATEAKLKQEALEDASGSRPDDEWDAEAL